MTLSEKAAELIKMKQKKTRAETRLKEINERMGVLEQDIHRTMLFEGFETITVQNYKLSPLLATYASIPADLSEAAFTELREHGYGGLIRESVHPSTLRGWIREMETDTKGELPGWIVTNMSIYRREEVNIRKLPKCKKKSMKVRK